MFVLTRKIFAEWQKMIELNLRASRSTLADVQKHALKALPFNDPQAALAWQLSLVGPLAEKIQTYHCDLYGIVASMQAARAAAAGTQHEAHNRNVQTRLKVS